MWPCRFLSLLARLSGSRDSLDRTEDPFEAFRQGGRVRTALLDPAVELLELHKPDGRGNFRHAVIVADEDVLVLRGLAMIPKEAGLLRDLVIVGDDHAAFARRHVLRR